MRVVEGLAGVVLGLVGIVAFVLFWRGMLRQAWAEEPAFGSKRWHWPAAAIAAVGLIVLGLLRASTGG